MAKYDIITGSNYIELINNLNTFLSGSNNNYYPIGNISQSPNMWLQVMFSESFGGNGFGGGN